MARWQGWWMTWILSGLAFTLPLHTLGRWWYNILFSSAGLQRSKVAVLSLNLAQCRKICVTQCHNFSWIHFLLELEYISCHWTWLDAAQLPLLRSLSHMRMRWGGWVTVYGDYRDIHNVQESSFLLLQSVEGGRGRMGWCISGITMPRRLFVIVSHQI